MAHGEKAMVLIDQIEIVSERRERELKTRTTLGAIYSLGRGYGDPSIREQLRPAQELAKHGISMPNAPGTIDSDYRGQVMVPLINLGQEAFEVRRSMRIAQMVILPVPRTQWLEMDQLPPSVRGEGGFGHTGQ